LTKGLDLILVSTDPSSEYENAVKFLDSISVNFLSYIKTGKDMEFINSIDQQWSGTLPTTFLFSKNGKILIRKEGEITLAELEQWMAKFLP